MRGAAALMSILHFRLFLICILVVEIKLFALEKFTFCPCRIFIATTKTAISAGWGCLFAAIILQLQDQNKSHTGKRTDKLVKTFWSIRHNNCSNIRRSKYF